MAIQNPGEGLLQIGNRTVGEFQSPMGQVTITENALDGNGRLSFFNHNGVLETAVVGPLSRGKLLGPWNFPGETDAVVEGAIPGCPDQAMFIGVTYNHVQVSHIPQCGQFRFEPASNGVLAIQQGPVDPEVFLFQSSQMQGPELYSQLMGQREVASQSSYAGRAAHDPNYQEPSAEPPPEATPPVDNTAGMPTAAPEGAPAGSAAPPPSLNLTNSD